MTIRKGEVWEEPYEGPAPVVSFETEVALAECAFDYYRQNKVLYARLLEGNLRRDLGLLEKETSEPLSEISDSVVRQQFAIDLGVVTLEGRKYPFVSHFLARGFLGSGRFVIAMNSGWKGKFYLGPKAHPNDGLLDITSGSLSCRDRLLALKKAKSGAHLQHPGLSYKRRSTWEEKFKHSLKMFRDDQFIGKYKSFEIELISDGFFLVV